jgi:hypothetical protein
MLRFRLPSGHELRPLEESDAEELYVLIDANRERLRRWMVWAEGQTPVRTLEFIRAAHGQLAGEDGFRRR